MPINSEKGSRRWCRIRGHMSDLFIPFCVIPSAVMLRSMRAPCSAYGDVWLVPGDPSVLCSRCEIRISSGEGGVTGASLVPFSISILTRQQADDRSGLWLMLLAMGLDCQFRYEDGEYSPDVERLVHTGTVSN